MSGPTVFILAGEPSGDLHGGALARELRRQNPGVRLRGIGGAAMREAGVELLHTLDEFSVLGFSEVIGRLPFFFRVLAELRALFRAEPPDVFIPLDFPDFNLRAAAHARAARVPVLWYISPQIWAWRPGRIKTLKERVDRMVVVFPFEEELYRAAGVPVEFVGHPLLEHPPRVRDRDAVRAALGVPAGRPLVALLPGSRRQEVRRILPPLADAGRRLRREGRASVAVSRAAGLPEELYREILADPAGDLPLWEGPAAELAGAADLAVVASGTATLETGLTGTPLVVVYRMGALNWEIARRLVRLPRIGLVNIAAGEDVAPELLQDDVTGEAVAALAGAAPGRSRAAGRHARRARPPAGAPGRRRGVAPHGGAGAGARGGAGTMSRAERHLWAAPLGRGLFRMLAATARVSRHGEANVRAAEAGWPGLVFAVWHGRLLLAALTHRGRDVVTMASRNSDGEIIARILGPEGFIVARGSSSRGGSDALKAMEAEAARGRRWLALTPDGPRGPRHVAQVGAAVLAARLGFVLLPTGVSARPARLFDSWDGFLLPAPFSRLAVVYGAPIAVPPAEDTAGVEAARAALETALRAVEAEADARVGRAPRTGRPA